jgi:hypothetical protein
MTFGRGEVIRTLGLTDPNRPLFQLSYTPYASDPHGVRDQGCGRWVKVTGETVADVIGIRQPGYSTAMLELVLIILAIIALCMFIFRGRV